MNHKDSGLLNIGIGATSELSLRVSIATLVRVILENPSNGELMLALERKATLFKGENRAFIEVKAQPFGGAIRIHDLPSLQKLIGDFRFDSEPSRSEQDFRIFIRPSAWETLRQFCLQHFREENDPVIESDPGRELVEEFEHVLKIDLEPAQFRFKPVRMMIEEHPSPAENVYSRGHPTVRIYRIFESRISDVSLISAMLMNSTNHSSENLRALALEDARKGGKGWANAVLTLPIEQIHQVYVDLSPEKRNKPISLGGHLLDETVAAVLDDIPVPKYRGL